MDDNDDTVRAPDDSTAPRQEKPPSPEKPPKPAHGRVASEPDRLPGQADYETYGGVLWNVIEWTKLANRFDLLVEQLPDWHATVVGTNQTWLILRRLYGVAPVFGAGLTEEDLRSWTVEELRKNLGIPASNIEDHVEKAVRFWRQREAAATQADPTPASEEAGAEDEILSLSLYSDLDEKRVGEILEAANFAYIKGEGLRHQIADRVVQLTPYLKQPNLRTTARTVIRLEVSMDAHEQNLCALHNAVGEEQAKEDPSTNKITELEKRIRSVEVQLGKLTEQHSEALEALGENDIDLNQKKALFTGDISYLIEKAAAYYQDPKNALCDSVFTADEIEWLLAPTDYREPQYRPDVVAVVAKALLPDQLYDPNSEPKGPPREVCRDLHRIVKHLRRSQDEAAAAAAEAEVSPDPESRGEAGPGEGAPSPVLAAHAPPAIPAPAGPTRKEPEANSYVF